MDRSFAQYIVVAAFLTILSHSAARDLRPSDHGLAYNDQEDTGAYGPAQGGGEEMLSFFGATTAAASTVELPEAKNITDAVWSGGGTGGARDAARRNHVRVGLLVASAVCGLTGVVLLTVSGVVFLVRLQKRRAGAEDQPSTSAPAFVANEKSPLGRPISVLPEAYKLKG